jgi:hypothetical protein
MKRKNQKKRSLTRHLKLKINRTKINIRVDHHMNKDHLSSMMIGHQVETLKVTILARVVMVVAEESTQEKKEDRKGTMKDRAKDMEIRNLMVKIEIRKEDKIEDMEIKKEVGMKEKKVAIEETVKEIMRKKIRMDMAEEAIKIDPIRIDRIETIRRTIMNNLNFLKTSLGPASSVHIFNFIH